jgi:HSP20 family protein
MANEVDNVFDHLFNSGSSENESSIAHPRLDVYEEEEKITIYMDLPGLSVSGLKVEAKDNVLTIAGERSAPAVQDGTKSWHRGIMYGKFQRAIQLPETVNCDAIEAAYDAGVLQVIVPKMPKPAPKVIQVRTADSANVTCS